MELRYESGRSIEYVHDPLGRRIAKKIDGTIVEKYLWQGMTRLLAVYDGNNALVMRFEYADARMPFAMTMGGAVYYLAYDQVGSLSVVADGSGNPVKRIDYDSFGNVFYDSAPNFAVPFGFAGGLYDKDTKLVRFGYRDYDPDTGRWTAKDPIGFNGGDTDLYGYCLGDPVNWVDPRGLDVTVVLYPGAMGNGHVGIGVNTDATQGFYPQSSWGIFGGQGIVQPDTKTPIDRITIPATPEQDAAIQAYIDAHGGTRNGRYVLISKNCARFVENALEAGNIPSSDAIRPKKLMEDLHTRYDNVSPIPDINPGVFFQP